MSKACLFVGILNIINPCFYISFKNRDGNGYPMGRVLQCPSPYPHLKKIHVPVPIPSWATT